MYMWTYWQISLPLSRSLPLSPICSEKGSPLILSLSLCNDFQHAPDFSLA